MKHQAFGLLTIVFALALIGVSGCYAAELKDGVTHLSQTEFKDKATQVGTVVIDIRTDREYKSGHIKGAKHIPITEIFANISLLDEYRGKDLVFYCHSGVRVRRLTDYLREIEHPNQSQLFHLKGDMRAWAARRLPIEK